jgi:hypothetical protein
MTITMEERKQMENSFLAEIRNSGLDGGPPLGENEQRDLFDNSSLIIALEDIRGVGENNSTPR